MNLQEERQIYVKNKKVFHQQNIFNNHLILMEIYFHFIHIQHFKIFFQQKQKNFHIFFTKISRNQLPGQGVRKNFDFRQIFFYDGNLIYEFYSKHFKILFFITYFSSSLSCFSHKWKKQLKSLTVKHKFIQLIIQIRLVDLSSFFQVFPFIFKSPLTIFLHP